MAKYIEINSGNRNRELYPLISDFEIPFAAALQNAPPYQADDPIVNGTIFYTFTLYPSTTIYASGTMQPGSSTTGIKLDPNQTPQYSQVPNFYVGFTIVDDGSPTKESRIIRTYDPSSGMVSFEKPFSAISNGAYHLYIGFPTQNFVFIPTVDDNGNPIDNTEQSYTGYYVVFETDNPTLYSNASNSNIFYRRISYYDNVSRIAYFDTPLPFSYDNVDTAQTFTLRQTLPMARWVLNAPSYINYTPPPPAQASIGPLVGPVIQLPADAPNEDNLYKGKYVYFSGNAPEYFSPPLPPPADLIKPIPFVFYPIYGAYYIRAYNGTTKELSVMKDIRNLPLPTYQNLPYDSSTFVGGTGVSSVTNVGGTTYRATFTPVGAGPTYDSTLFLAPPRTYARNRTYELRWTIRKSANISLSSFVVPALVDYYSTSLADSYQTFVFRITPYEGDLAFTFTSTYNPADPGDKYVEWSSFEMIQVDTINICTFQKDNFSPLMYSGTMVGLNEVVCYDVSLTSLTLPNVPLTTGSAVAFYPFTYLLLQNVTAPSASSTNVIYSNNPVTARALFICVGWPIPDPNAQAFVSISSSTSHTIKFKPNDNLRLAVFLGDGTPFTPLVPDILSPYPSRVQFQLNAVFSVTRNSQGK